MSIEDASQIVEILDGRLVALIDLSLVLKHIHWNVVGPHFIAVHEMLDKHLEEVRVMVDDVAERIATMGGTPIGTAGYVAKARTWDDYDLNKATVPEHLAALDIAYSGIITDHREAEEKTTELDPVTNDLVIGQLAGLEHLQWLIRAHLEGSTGELITANVSTEKGAAKKAREAISN
ncbi:MAG TPA: DNA starvation/stationary phase protection protein [Acidimicrobiia bacterium]|nr:DNA starvation/stationary phase protection protein [Acidimicrobiia bacterium]